MATVTMINKNKHSILLCLILFLLLVFSSSLHDQKQVYIVYLGEHSTGSTKKALNHEIEKTHHYYLSSVKQTDEEATASLIYSYKHSINGFAALLTSEEAQKLSELNEVISVFKSYPRKYSLHTTRSWEFSGLYKDLNSIKTNFNKERQNILKMANYGENIIVGLLDNGWWPEASSFSDKGMGPVPKSWKGICQTGIGYNASNCNRKLIGARYYVRGYEAYYGPLNTTVDYLSPRDKDGHGTHTSSTVGGRRVPNASALGGFASGTATGGAPLARLAMYKVCWPIPNQGKEEGNTCFDEDMLAAIDDAIADGVHVLSISIGSHEPVPYDNSGISIGALHAEKNDVVVVCSAGNEGPYPGTVTNTAPWILTVGASSVDRKFYAPVILGNGQKIEGETVTPYKLKKKMYPLVYAGQVVNSNVPKTSIAGQCLPGSLSPKKTKGKIVLCFRGNGNRLGKGLEVKRAGGVGYILGNDLLNGGQVLVEPLMLPATAVNAQNAIKIFEYINSTKKPMAYIPLAKTMIHTTPAPFMANFTSRGPSIVSPQILKPDVTAPGLNILAAWTKEDSPTRTDFDHRVVDFNIFSGTSMACPHVAALAALIKSIHPTWSSAAVRSAIMTTASLMNNQGKEITDAEGKPADPFQFGSGHFNPTKAIDPGLIYNTSYNDYLLYICRLEGLNLTRLAPLNYNCPQNPKQIYDLNYPSLALTNISGTVNVRRTVTNVGGGRGVYFSKVGPPVGYSVKITPSILYFKHLGEKKEFTIIVKAQRAVESRNSIDEKLRYSFGWYAWNDGLHNVRSPIAAVSSIA